MRAEHSSFLDLNETDPVPVKLNASQNKAQATEKASFLNADLQQYIRGHNQTTVVGGLK